jgi:hypothetical protein
MGIFSDITSEFTGLRGFSRRFGGMMGYAAFTPGHIEVQLLAAVLKPSIGEESRRFVFQ